MFSTSWLWLQEEAQIQTPETLSASSQEPVVIKTVFSIDWFLKCSILVYPCLVYLMSTQENFFYPVNTKIDTLAHKLSRKKCAKRLKVSSFYMWLTYGALIHYDRGEGRYSLVSPVDNLCSTVWHRLLCRAVWIVLLTTEGWRVRFRPLPTPFPT